MNADARGRLLLWLGLPLGVFSAILGAYVVFFERFPNQRSFLSAFGLHPRWMVALLVVVAVPILPAMLR
jgi:hypothetical protein